MPHRFAEIAFTPQVKTLQEKLGSRRSYARLADIPESVNQRLSDREMAFISARDSFYVATVGESGWPYVQHRGGPAGFVRILDDTTIGFADFRGNRQYVTLGNVTGDNRVSMIFMDYAKKSRLKLFGRATIVEPDDVATLSRLELPSYRAQVDRGFLISVEAFDWNCPQHITVRLAHDEVRAATEPLLARIAGLEAALVERGPSRTLS